MNYTELEARLDADLQAARDAGWQIVRRMWGDGEKKRCCAVTAGVLLEDSFAFDCTNPHKSTPSTCAQDRLSLEWDQLDAVINGFDGNDFAAPEWDIYLYRIGKRLAKKYLGA